MDGSARCVSPRATNLGAHRASRALRWRSANTLDDSGTTRAESAKSPPDTRAQTKSARASRRRRRKRDDTTAKRRHRITQLREVRRVSARQRIEHDIKRCSRRELRRPGGACQFAKSALESIAIDGAVLVTRHHNADAMRVQKGSKDPNLKLRGSDSLPFAADHQEVCRARQPPRRRHAARCLRRLRTSTGASRSAACAPSYGAGSTPRAPTWFPCARGIRAS